MADLIQEFFKRDLNGSELDALGKLLEKRPEDALRFESKLEHYYLSTLGLPQPDLPRSLLSLPKPKNWLKGWLGGLGGWMGLGALAFAGMVAVAVYRYESSQAKVAPPAVATPATTPTTVPSTLKKALALPSLSSVPEKVKPGAQGDALSIVVTAAQDSLITVRILDSSGKELRVLYSGFVRPGDRVFKWDGLLSDGKPAPPGNYQIHVQSGKYGKIKNIKMEPKKLSPSPQK